MVGEVVEQGREKKILVFHYKRKKQYKKLRGHRQQFTAVRIIEIAFDGQKFTAPELPKKVAKAKKAAPAEKEEVKAREGQDTGEEESGQEAGGEEGRAKEKEELTEDDVRQSWKPHWKNMAHKKGQGTSRNGRDSNSQRLGFKAFGGQLVPGGTIIVRQRGNAREAGAQRGRGKDDTLFAKITGRIKFKDRGQMGKFVMIEPVEAK